MKADPRGKRKLTVEEWHDVFNKSDAGGYVKLTYGTILEFEDSVRRAALASQPNDLKGKLEALRDELYNGETLTRTESSEDSTPEDAYSEGSQAAEKRIREWLTAIIEGKD